MSTTRDLRAIFCYSSDVHEFHKKRVVFTHRDFKMIYENCFHHMSDREARLIFNILIFLHAH